MRLRRKKEWDLDAVLAKQLEMNPLTLQQLEKHGVTENTELRLDFSFDAPGSSQAEELAAFLAQETDYDVRISNELVEGTTQPTCVSHEILDQWVRWMVLAGYENGRCEFDGWGAMIP